MQTTELRDIAGALRTARANGEPVAAPTTTWPDLDADAAFEVQRINVEEAVAHGDRLVGYKLGNIAKVMQDAFGLDQPASGTGRSTSRTPWLTTAPPGRSSSAEPPDGSPSSPCATPGAPCTSTDAK